MRNKNRVNILLTALGHRPNRIDTRHFCSAGGERIWIKLSILLAVDLLYHKCMYDVFGFTDDSETAHCATPIHPLQQRQSPINWHLMPSIVCFSVVSGEFAVNRIGNPAFPHPQQHYYHHHHHKHRYPHCLRDWVVQVFYFAQSTMN